ncbi:EcsC family protein [Paenibacillus alkaliterrae]|uniref:EcsC family protein n=1 Tax=Paenibacillus alkaliterrae TaxID=320909 RepID=UPI001F202594|nr:EcsC family protein [Paenibacillus alkaliterrae]MCF2937124.1 EcsC family protein [Paenibacillus alkaliterrae]
MLVQHVFDTKEQLAAALREIEAWEREQKDLWFWEKLGRLPFMLLDKVTPKFIQEKLRQAVDEIGGYIQNGGKYLVSERSVMDRLQRNAEQSMAESDTELTIDNVAAMPLSAMNLTAAQLSSSRSTMATLQGATTGIGGIFTLAVDIPAVLGLSLKIIQEIAICYGFDPKLKEERVFAVKVMQFASSDIVGKKAILEELSDYHTGHKSNQMMSQLQGWREVVAVYRDNFGWKKLFQMIPVAGMLFGAFINRGMLNDVAEAATMLYRKRRVLLKLAEGEAAR